MTTPDPSTSPAAPAAHDCLHPDHFERGIADLEAAIKDLSVHHQGVAAHIEEAVAAGIRRAVADSATWEAASVAIRAQAQSAAGGWLLGGVRAAVTKVAWVVAIVAGLYALGGLPAVLAWIKAGAAQS